MTIEVREQDLVSLYHKAKKKYKECINYQENEFLKDEVNTPLEHVVLKEKDIKIVFSQNITSGHLLEVTLILYEGNKEIGTYMYMENETGNEVDDRLVFF